MGDESSMFGTRMSFNSGVEIPAKSAIEEVVVTSQPVSTVVFTPISISKTRYSEVLDVQKPTEDVLQGEDVFTGVRPSDWTVEKSDDQIIVDDLDEGFRLGFQAIGDSEELLVDHSDLKQKLDRSENHLEWDFGIPAYRTKGYGDLWSRVDARRSWGRYRPTLVYAEAGAGDWHVSFTTNLPSEGHWLLEYHWPIHYSPSMFSEFTAGTQPLFDKRFPAFFPPVPMADFHMKLETSDGVQPLNFTPSRDKGWKYVGEFEIRQGQVTLYVSNRTDGAGVIADAIRWRMTSDNEGPK